MDSIITQSNNLLSSVTGREQVELMHQEFRIQIEEGNINPLEFAIKARMIIKALEQTLTDTQYLAINEQEKHGKTAEMFGAVATTSEMGVKYDYESCNDIEWIILKENVERTTEMLKAREKWLRSLTKPENIVDANGEIITITPPIKRSTTTLKVTMK
jgi:hypothetical protein